MKVRRTRRSIDLRNLPLDGFDMFLLTQLESTLALPELLDIAPCDHDETLRRLHQLIAFQLVELEAKPGEVLPQPRVKAEKPSRPDAQPVRPRGEAQVARPQFIEVPPMRPQRIEVPMASASFEDEDTSTLRPPPGRKREQSRVMPRVSLDEEAATLRPPPAPLATARPPSPLAVQEMMRAADDSSVKRIVDRSSGVVEKKDEKPALEFETARQVVAADGRVVKDRSVFSRATLVDDDAEERAQVLRDPARR